MIWSFLHRIPRSGAFWFLVWTLAVIAATAGLWYAWYDDLRDGDSLSTAIRNIGLMSGGLVALALAVWRSLVAQRQAETAQRSLLNDRYHRAVELLASDKKHIRIGAIHALRNVVFEDPKEFGTQTMTLLRAFQGSFHGEPERKSATDRNNPTLDDPELEVLKSAIGDISHAPMFVGELGDSTYDKAITRIDRRRRAESRRSHQ